MLLKQLRHKQTTPTLIYIDNLPAIQMINDNSSPTDSTRQIDICYFSLQDQRINGSIIMVHIKGILNPSNDLIKTLGYILHSCHCCCVMGYNDE